MTQKNSRHFPKWRSFYSNQLQMWNQLILLHQRSLGSLEIKVWLQTHFHFWITWIIGIICSIWIHNSLHLILILNGTPLNLQCKILTPGTPGFSHHTNQLLGLLDGGISIQGTSFLNSLHINRFLNSHTLLNILSLISSRSCNCRTMLPLVCQYNLSCLINLILTQIIKHSINLRLSTCLLTPLLMFPAMIFAYDQER